MRKYTFSFKRTVNIWNSLSETVISPNSTKLFETKLDNFWNRRKMEYDYRAPIVTGQIPNTLETVKEELGPRL